MTKADRQKRDECMSSKCQYFWQHCKVYHGKQCKQQGGTKIPSMWKIDPRTNTPIKKDVQISTRRPYFMKPDPNSEPTGEAI